LIQTLGIESHVTYKGYLTGADYEAVWAGAGALVFPSNYEGFGLPLLEAMEWGIPIIASNLPSLREVAASAALFVDQHSPDAIARGLQAICENENLRNSLIENGKARLENFNWQLAATTFSNLTKNLLASRSQSTS
jgi:glycosyltransferase involved in cell wall biosynthesis